MDWIAARYEDCLCSHCLEKIAAGELKPQRNLTNHNQGDRARH